jgi:hypothetical protein
VIPQLPQLKAVKGAVTISADTSAAPSAIAPAATKGAASKSKPQQSACALVVPTTVSKARLIHAIIKVDLTFMFLTSGTQFN